MASATDGWAVGHSARGGLIEHWNGRVWKVQDSPDLGPRAGLEDVAVTSSTDAWAVGHGHQGDIEHWNGRRWIIQKSPDASRIKLIAVTALSASQAWAVGNTVIEHWDGHAWRMQSVPKHIAGLSDVVALSPTDAWAVGYHITSQSPSGPQARILHWDGHAWTVVKSPWIGRFGGMEAIAAADSTHVWALAWGTHANAAIEFWDGDHWKTQLAWHSDLELLGLTATSASDAWAVGGVANTGPPKPLIVHWDGTAWSRRRVS